MVDLSILASSEERLPEVAAVKNKQAMKDSSTERDSRGPLAWRDCIASSRLQDGMVLETGGLAKKWLFANRSNSTSETLMLKAISRGILREFL